MRRTALAMLVAIAASTLIVVLALQNRGLRADRRALLDDFELRRSPYPGMFTPIIAARTLDESPVTLGAPAHGDQLLYFFRPGCSFCRDSAPAIRRLAALVAGRSGPTLELIGIGDGSVDEVRRVAHEQGIGFPVVALNDVRTLALFHARTVPALVLIDADGRVQYAHVGALDAGEAFAALFAVADRTVAKTPHHEEEEP